MRAIKTRPRFHCDFCSHTATKAAMEAHEHICWLNPNRHCPSCDNKGYYLDDYGGGYERTPPTPTAVTATGGASLTKWGGSGAPHGVPSRVDRLRALGNAVVPQVAEVVGRMIVDYENRLKEVQVK